MTSTLLSSTKLEIPLLSSEVLMRGKLPAGSVLTRPLLPFFIDLKNVVRLKSKEIAL